MNCKVNRIPSLKSSKMCRKIAVELFLGITKCSYFVRIQYRHPLRYGRIWMATDGGKLVNHDKSISSNFVFHNNRRHYTEAVQRMLVWQITNHHENETSRHPLHFIFYHVVEDVCTTFWQSMGTRRFRETILRQFVQHIFDDFSGWILSTSQFIIRISTPWAIQKSI